MLILQTFNYVREGFKLKINYFHGIFHGQGTMLGNSNPDFSPWLLRVTYLKHIDRGDLSGKIRPWGNFWLIQLSVDKFGQIPTVSKYFPDKSPQSSVLGMSFSTTIGKCPDI